jgi:hypothetical protein
LITPRLALSSSFAYDHICSYIVPRERVPVGELATRLGLAYSTVLGKAQERPLSPALREKLHALQSEHLAAKR